VIHRLRFIRTRKSGVPEERKGISAKSKIRSREMSKMELLSPNVQIKGSNICMGVPWASANCTALSVNRKQRTNASPKVTRMRGFFFHCRKL
jgi:hypothetical protein